MAITPEQNTSPGVATHGFGLNAKKVLCEEQVFISITIEIGHTDAKGRGELGFGGQNNTICVRAFKR